MLLARITKSALVVAVHAIPLGGTRLGDGDFGDFHGGSNCSLVVAELAMSLIRRAREIGSKLFTRSHICYGAGAPASLRSGQPMKRNTIFATAISAVLGLCASAPVPEGVSVHAGGTVGRRHVSGSGCGGYRYDAAGNYAAAAGGLSYRAPNGVTVTAAAMYLGGFNNTLEESYDDGEPPEDEDTEGRSIVEDWGREVRGTSMIGYQHYYFGALAGARLRYVAERVQVVPTVSVWAGIPNDAYFWVQHVDARMTAGDSMISLGVGHLDRQLSIEVGGSFGWRDSFDPEFRWMVSPGLVVGKQGLLEGDFLLSNGGNVSGGLSFRWSFEADAIRKLTGPYERAKPRAERRRGRTR